VLVAPPRLAAWAPAGKMMTLYAHLDQLLASR
jgi:hypothetical protein